MLVTSSYTKKTVLFIRPANVLNYKPKFPLLEFIILHSHIPCCFCLHTSSPESRCIAFIFEISETVELILSQAEPKTYQVFHSALKIMGGIFKGNVYIFLLSENVVQICCILLYVIRKSAGA